MVDEVVVEFCDGVQVLVVALKLGLSFREGNGLIRCSLVVDAVNQTLNWTHDDYHWNYYSNQLNYGELAQYRVSEQQVAETVDKGAELN